MYENVVLVELALWVGLPAWIANSTPVIFGGGRPIDGGRTLRDGRRVFGDNKTVKGLLAGVFFGTLTSIIQYILAPSIAQTLAIFVELTTERLEVLYMSPLAGLLLSIGAMTGDLMGSFIKRRVNIASGGPCPLLDQLGFIVMALLLASPIFRPSYQYTIILILATLVMHWFSNVIGYLMGYKRQPW